MSLKIKNEKKFDFELRVSPRDPPQLNSTKVDNLFPLAKERSSLKSFCVFDS